MTISGKAWERFVALLGEIDEKAVTEMLDYIARHPGWAVNPGVEQTVAFAYGLATKYGEASAAVACEMYDALAAASGLTLPPAIPAETASYGEVAKTIYGTVGLHNEEIVSSSVGRLVKQAGADTTLKNAIRDGAQVAWIPSGDTCAYCLTLASRGWQKASKDTVKNGHAEHIHANCDCSYAVRFDERTQVAGYRPEEYKTMYKNADGSSPKAKINSLRREFYAENSERINAQKRSAYAKRRERESSAAEEIDV